MSLSVRIEDGLFIPAEAEDFSFFRGWARSADFPDRGRIDYLQGTVEVDMSAEELQTHGTLKVKLVMAIGRLAEEVVAGQVFADRTRLTSESAGLSCEPDIVFVSLEALRSGRVSYAGQKEHLTEIEGAPDLVVEVVSSSSVGKDKKRLPPLYAQAGIQEYWLADARGKTMEFRVMHLRDGRYEPAAVDADGFHESRVFGCRVRVTREAWHLAGTWNYPVEIRPLST